MDSILYSIYAGELHPAEHIKPRFVPEEYAACARRLQKQKDLLCAKLPPEDRAEVELYNAQGSLLDFDTFACGVRFGVRLLSDLYGGEPDRFTYAGE